MQMVANGYGVTLLPRIALAVEARDERVKVLRFRDPEPARSIGLAWRRTSPRKADFVALGQIVRRHARLHEESRGDRRGPGRADGGRSAGGGGAHVTVYDRMPSAGRKFLMAGRGGLNLTHSEELEAFLRRYGAARARIARRHRGVSAGCAARLVRRASDSRPSSDRAGACFHAP